MVKLNEMVFRDAHQSLIATRMKTEDMLPACPILDEVGYNAVEAWGGATFDVCIRYLNEDPWERLRKIKERMPNTPIQMLERGMNIVAYKNFPPDVVEKFIYYARKNGVDIFRIFDALNDMENLKFPIKTVKKYGGHAQCALCYTISPIHSIERYIEDFIMLQKMGCDSLAIKDMAGLISPKRAYDIISGMKDAGIKVPIVLHSHYTSGMAGMSYMAAAEAGVDILDTAISPFAGGSSFPPTEAIVAGFKETEYDTEYDLETLFKARKYFMEVWKKYSKYHSMETIKFDPSVMIHQLPGGMISNLIMQLKQQDAMDKFYKVLEEIPRVRKDLGYPPLVTPTSQIIGYQALLNVLFGRYKKISKETKDYVRGMYGKPPGEISKEIYEIILGKNWKDEIIEGRAFQHMKPLYNEKKKELEEMGLLKKEEDVLTYILYPQVAIRFFKGEVIEMDKKVAKMYRIKVDGKVYTARIVDGKIEVNGKFYDVEIMDKGKGKIKEDEVEIKTPMLGVVVDIKVAEGQKIRKNDVVAVIEAMKMENEILSPVDGIVKKILVEKGQNVNAGDIIVMVEKK